ncbi:MULTISPECIES: ArnT family glycosyltransferase [Enterococcus]|uniref:ArnT family glycosyltransferase n=1 Tax=Enterococcus TaxID=1350 RepID=UPI001FE93CCA|nr:glycosyltransferase family 39 protein [Enterococcus alishanensis]
MKRKIDIYLAIILILALFLYAWGIWDAGSANSYYTAAVTSMVQSWHNFFYGAFDAAGFITVDKPPVALWFMAISAKIFGVHGWSVVLPSVLFGVGSVYLMYRLVKPRFGVLAGRIAALTMTLTPIVVANSRTNNMDATLVFFMLLAVRYVFKAVEVKKQRYLWIGFALIGVAFNVKMLQAFMILPALYLFYFFASSVSWKKKIVHSAVATIFLAVFTLAYPVYVDHVSASDRPYIGSSQTNSLLELAFGYNGTERLLGQSTGTGGTFPGMGNSGENNTQDGQMQPPSGNNSEQGMTPPTDGGNANQMPSNNTSMETSQGDGFDGERQGGGPGGTGGGGGAFNIGSAGPLRLFQSELGPQVSWLLPLALISLVASFFYFRNKKKWYRLTKKQAHIMFWGVWLVAVGSFFSIASFFHPYYLIMLAPPIAAGVGIGIASLFKKDLSGGKKIIVGIAGLSTAGLQAYFLASYSLLAAGLVVAATIILIGLLFISKLKVHSKKIIYGLLTVLFIAPAFWSLTPTLAHQSAAIPTTGPELLSQGGATGGLGSESVNEQLLAYLEENQGSAEYLFATTDSNSASPYIIASGKAVMAIGGYNGTDPAITLKQFKQLVKAGKIKYFYASGNKNSTSDIAEWVAENGTEVDASEYGGQTTTEETNSQPENASDSTEGTIQSNQIGLMQGAGMGGGMDSGTLYQLSADSVN